jgi:hypothetical protein
MISMANKFELAAVVVEEVLTTPLVKSGFESTIGATQKLLEDALPEAVLKDSQTLSYRLSSGLSRIQTESAHLMRTMGFTAKNSALLKFFDSHGNEYFETLPKPRALHSGSPFKFAKLPGLELTDMTTEMRQPFTDSLSHVMDNFPRLLDRHPGKIFMGHLESTGRKFRFLNQEEEQQIRSGNFDVLRNNVSLDKNTPAFPDSLLLSGNATNTGLFKENFFKSLRNASEDETIQLSGTGAGGRLNSSLDGRSVNLSVGPKEISALLKGAKIEDLLKRASPKRF